MPANIQQFENESYLNLETYRKNNHPIVTPVWFILKDNDIFVVTKEKTGKVKRIKNNNVVRVIPCNYRGISKGTWVTGTWSAPDTADGFGYMHDLGQRRTVKCRPRKLSATSFRAWKASKSIV